MPPARRGGSSVAAVLVGSGFLVWTVAVAVDRNDKDVFPPVLPAALGDRRPRPRGGLRPSETERLGVRAHGARRPSLLVATLFTSLYPRVMVSSPDFANSLTDLGAASAHYTLAVMTVVALIVLAARSSLYQGWTYYVFRHGSAATSPSRACDAGTAGRRAAA